MMLILMTRMIHFVLKYTNIVVAVFVAVDKAIFILFSFSFFFFDWLFPYAALSQFMTFQ